MLTLVINTIVRAIEVIAAVMIAASVAIAAVKMGAALARRAVPERRTKVRLALAERLVLSLEFLIAADILKTVLAPTLDQLAVLGGVILIRTVLSLSIAYELRRSAVHALPAAHSRYPAEPQVSEATPSESLPDSSASCAQSRFWR